MHNYIVYFFWACILIVLYTYLGYGLILILLVKIKKLFQRNELIVSKTTPNVTLLIAAFDEEAFIRKKIENSIQLDYPKDRFQLLFVTDGSRDKTPEIIKEFPVITSMYLPERKGKISAIQRAIPKATGEIVVFSDANTLLNRGALKKIIRHFGSEKVGVVAGEKRVISRESDEAVGAGEGLYWKYESKLKKWDHELHSVMGAAGELFAIRKPLYEPIPSDIIIEDFYLSLKIVQKGYKIAYEPNAYSLEEPSASIKEELKRKVRIAAGGIQAVVRLTPLLNPLKYGIVTFQYIAHRVLRWTLAPLALPIIFVCNAFLFQHGGLYQALFLSQVSFYLMALLGYLLEKKHIRFKILFIPYYFCLMNYAVFAGFKRYLQGSQSVLWEKAERRSS